jgi:hypothetical protein
VAKTKEERKLKIMSVSLQTGVLSHQRTIKTSKSDFTQDFDIDDFK